MKILIKSGLYYWRSNIICRNTLIAGEAIYHGRERKNVSYYIKKKIIIGFQQGTWAYMGCIKVSEKHVIHKHNLV